MDRMGPFHNRGGGQGQEGGTRRATEDEESGGRHGGDCEQGVVGEHAVSVRQRKTLRQSQRGKKGQENGQRLLVAGRPTPRWPALGGAFGGCWILLNGQGRGYGRRDEAWGMDGRVQAERRLEGRYWWRDMESGCGTRR